MFLILVLIVIGLVVFYLLMVILDYCVMVNVIIELCKLDLVIFFLLNVLVISFVVFGIDEVDMEVCILGLVLIVGCVV